MTKVYPNKVVPFLMVALTFCFLSGCTHGRQVVTDSPIHENVEVENYDLEPENAAAYRGDDDFFEQDDDEPFVLSELKKEGRLVADPLYYFNISMYHFNDKLYFWCLKPVANTYKAVTPEFFRIGVRNFSHFLSTPARFISCLLQGKIKGAGTEVGRLLINSTLGFCGLIDTAEHSFQLKEMDEDLGQVLGKYSIGNGFYLYLPFLGPTTLRDAIGKAGEYFLDPVIYFEDSEIALSYVGLSKLNSTSFMIGDYEAVKAASLDPYTMIRDFYIEHRNKQIRE